VADVDVGIHAAELVDRAQARAREEVATPPPADIVVSCEARTQVDQKGVDVFALAPVPHSLLDHLVDLLAR
jgi:hypothetical protein